MIIGMVQPFAVHGVSTLFAKYDRNPVAYNRERGLLLQKEYRHWIWLNYLLHFFAEREVAGCVFLTSVFVLTFWARWPQIPWPLSPSRSSPPPHPMQVFPLSALFIPDLLYPPESPNTEYATFFEFQVNTWVSEDEQVEHFCLFFAFLTLPFIITILAKLLINTAGLELCGSLVRKLEIHYYTRSFWSSSLGWRHLGVGRDLIDGQGHAVEEFDAALFAEEFTKPLPGDGAFKGLEAKQLTALRSTMSLRCYVNLGLMIFLVVTATVLVLIQTILSRFGSYEWPRLYFITPHAIIQIFSFSVGIVTLLSACNLVIIQCKLLRANIIAYKDLLDSTCMVTNLTMQRLRVELQAEHEEENDGPDFLYGACSICGMKGHTAENCWEGSAGARVLNAPIVKSSIQMQRDRETYLVAVADELMHGEVGTTVEAVYAFVMCMYVFFVIFSFLVFLKVHNHRDVSSHEFEVAIGLVVAICLTLLAVVQPLRAMAEQEKAWQDVVKSAKSDARRQLSVVLSTSNDPDEMRKRLESLTENFTWNLVGIDVTYGNLLRIVAKYLSSLLLSTVVPAVINLILKLQSKYFKEESYEALVEAQNYSVQAGTNEIVVTSPVEVVQAEGVQPLT